MIRGSREIEDALLKHLGVKRNGEYIATYLLGFLFFSFFFFKNKNKKVINFFY